MREDSVGEAGDSVLLVDDQRSAKEPCGDATRPADKPAQPEDDVGSLVTHECHHLSQRPEQHERRDQQPRDALATQAADVDPVDRNAGGGDEPRFYALTGAHPAHIAVPGSQHAGDGQRREHVPARTAGHDEHLGHLMPPRIVTGRLVATS